MPRTPTPLEQLKSLLAYKRSKAFYAQRLGITVPEVDQLLSQLKGLPPSTKYASSKEEDFNSGTAVLSRSFPNEIKTLEELVEKCNIDLSVWNIDKYIQNYWGNTDNPHWQVKAFLSRRKEDKEDKIINFLSKYKSNYTPIEKEDVLLNIVLDSAPVCAFVSLADPHIDKQTLDGTTIKQKTDTYLEVLHSLLVKSYGSQYVDEIVFVLGNDFFTSDSYHGATTNGTPQKTTDEFDAAYEAGFDLAVQAISMCKQFCNKVKVVFVPANHDRTKSFYLVHALEVYFKKEKNIFFDRSAENSKVHVYGQAFIGMHHGDTVMEKLPLYFASKFKEQWGSCKYAEIAIADKHHKKQWRFSLTENEDMGTRMFIAPSLTTPDQWHKGKLFDLSIQSGVVRFYEKDKGYCGEFECRI